ncbi:hypothetical protein LNP74_28590 [Klebsiella pneumoniae subsp. pneumoniae]|nr:hypothetical protein [Klebsiella pneumoniae subsp. pneumoniae]
MQNIIQHNLAQRKAAAGAGGIDRRAGNQRIYGPAARAERQRGPFANTVLSLEQVREELTGESAGRAGAGR